MVTSVAAVVNVLGAALDLCRICSSYKDFAASIKSDVSQAIREVEDIRSLIEDNQNLLSTGKWDDSQDRRTSRVAVSKVDVDYTNVDMPSDQKAHTRTQQQGESSCAREFARARWKCLCILNAWIASLHDFQRHVSGPRDPEKTKPCPSMGEDSLGDWPRHMERKVPSDTGERYTLASLSFCSQLIALFQKCWGDCRYTPFGSIWLLLNICLLFHKTLGPLWHWILLATLRIETPSHASERLVHLFPDLGRMVDCLDHTAALGFLALFASISSLIFTTTILAWQSDPKRRTSTFIISIAILALGGSRWNILGSSVVEFFLILTPFALSLGFSLGLPWTTMAMRIN